MASSSTEQSTPQETTTTAPNTSGTSGTSSATTVISTLSHGALHDDLPPLIDDETTNNFPEWNLKAYILLRTWEILKYIEGPESALPNMPPLRESVVTTGYDKDNVLREVCTVGNAEEHNRALQEAKPWIEGNDLVLAKLLKALPLSQLQEFKNERHAKAVWNGLREFYLPLNSDRTDTIQSDIGSNKCTLDMDLDQWLLEMKRQYDTLSAIDEQLMTKREFTLTILRNMPKTDAWRVIVNGYKSQIADYDKRGISIKPSEFISKIRDENWLYTKDNPQSSNYVFAARADARKKAQKRKTTEQSSPKSVKCARTDDSNDKRQTCPNCAKEGHGMAQCLMYKGGNAGNYPSWWHGPWNIHLPPEKRTQQNRAKPSTLPASTKSPTTSTAKAAVCYVDSTADNISYAHITDADESDEDALSAETPTEFICNLQLGNQGSRSDACYFDSGANRHVFHDCAAFTEYAGIGPLTVKGFDRDVTASAIGCGTVRLASHLTGRQTTLLLTNVLHIPTAHSNLISGALLAKRGINILSAGDTFTLFSGVVTVASGVMHGDMYKLDVSIIHPPTHTQHAPPRNLISRISPAVATISPDHSGFGTA